MPHPPQGFFPFGLSSLVDAYVQGLQRVMMPSLPPCEYVGMADYAPASFLELLCNETLESDGSTDGDAMALDPPPS